MEEVSRPLLPSPDKIDNGIDDGSGTGINHHDPFQHIEKDDDFKVINAVDSLEKIRDFIPNSLRRRVNPLIRKKVHFAKPVARHRSAFTSKNDDFKGLFDPRPILSDTDRLIQAANGLKYAIYLLALSNLISSAMKWC